MGAAGRCGFSGYGWIFDPETACSTPKACGCPNNNWSATITDAGFIPSNSEILSKLLGRRFHWWPALEQI
jgi:hypothetical protein